MKRLWLAALAVFAFLFLYDGRPMDDDPVGRFRENEGGLL